MSMVCKSTLNAAPRPVTMTKTTKVPGIVPRGHAQGVLARRGATRTGIALPIQAKIPCEVVRAVSSLRSRAS